ncbi:ArsR family transcriptional regulator [Acidocella aminolytica 101 = DSM 11237]|jgi:ArsR family transcriptional regulator|uniref:Transcriptional regulator ArsR n=1 Tax=Acidocella aminolytica 101 = DSM 11237 TaxID=1120923 RepID=A0A0D6PET6_9PROT|nr:metalloregulator ArsR/SmtB family transcription factor [Acidocella aminolytica]GAN80260.1 transcriptional regulator ArsR [Acidocella aminolytica 101 = DSM 11237]GBQ44673.1 putative transcriptional regulator [Acidocella aminolytica 101 = DSM 11237]SHE92812.1 ArsR family transcriptional regulator [Acidocella aminolytica 101 = DSM 11237]
MTKESLPALDDILKALSNPVRLKILRGLRTPAENFPGQEHPYEWGVCANKIETICGLSQSSVSGHLSILHQAGLVTAKKVGQWIFYQRNEAAIAQFLADLKDNL